MRDRSAPDILDSLGIVVIGEADGGIHPACLQRLLSGELEEAGYSRLGYITVFQELYAPAEVTQGTSKV
jgi:hypothetical protein